VYVYKYAYMYVCIDFCLHRALSKYHAGLLISRCIHLRLCVIFSYAHIFVSVHKLRERLFVLHNRTDL